MSVGHISEVDKTIRDAAFEAVDSGDKVGWGELVGLHVSGKSRAADMGFDIGDEVAKLSDVDLLEFRYQIIDAFSPGDEDELSPIEHLTRGLIEIVQAELGGRWVR